jgi:hypothetical protein
MLLKKASGRSLFQFKPNFSKVYFFDKSGRLRPAAAPNTDTKTNDFDFHLQETMNRGGFHGNIR